MKRLFTVFATLWLSTLSAQWTQISNIPIPAHTLSTFEMDIDGNNLYAVTEAGIHKSTNNGGSWTEIVAPVAGIYPEKVHASGNTVCYIAWDEAENGYDFFYSTDGGATFQESGQDEFSFITSFLVDGNDIFVLEGHGFYVSNDQGATFTNTGLFPDGGPGSTYFGDIQQTPAGKILVVGFINQFNYPLLPAYVYRSTDNVNWTALNVSGGSNPLPCGQTGYEAYWTSAGYINGTLLIGSYQVNGSPGALYKSTDLGENWYPVDNSLFQYLGHIYAFGSDRIYVEGYSDSDYGLYTSTDGNNWTISDLPYGVFPFDGEGTKFVAADYYGGGTGTWLSTNNGATWAQTAAQIQVPDYDVMYDYLSTGNTKFLVTQWHGIYRGTGSNPANLSWTKVLGAGVNNGGDRGSDILKKGNTLLAGIDGYDGNGGTQGIYRSTNNGNTWARTHDGSGLCFFDDGNTVYAGVRYEGLFKSTDQGQTWTAINNGIPSFRSPYEILRAGNKLVALFFYGGIYTSSNGGNSWTQACSEYYGYCMEKAGSTLFAGMQNGLMKSTDNGQTWAYVENDLHNTTAVTALYVQDEQLYIGTGSQGIYLSTDSGETLESVNDGAGDNTYVSYIGRDGPKMLAGWNTDPGWGYYSFIPSQSGRGLWYQNAGNGQGPTINDRGRKVEATDLHLSIFPNPVREVLRFTLNTDLEKVSLLQIINGKGQVIREETGPLKQPTLDVHDLPNGMYFLNVSLLDGKVLRQPFMVMQGH